MKLFHRLKNISVTLLLIFALLFSSVSCNKDDKKKNDAEGNLEHLNSFNASYLPEYSGYEYITVNGNVPYFTEDEKVTRAYESYYDLDSLGRCTLAKASLHFSLMPTEDRESISSVKPTGWVQKTYDSVPGRYLYNRCHLIGFQLSGENALEENLITGTRYMNEAMIPFENMVAAYLKETNNHVMYRVTPIFRGGNLLANGVLVEAYSVEDEGDGICFNVYFFNAQPGIVIDYATGDSYLEGTGGNFSYAEKNLFVINKSNGKIHMQDCKYAKSMKESNRMEKYDTLMNLISDGYSLAGCCFD